jgi:putative DNA primase/helicase
MNFLDHAARYGLIIDRLISDGRWHRVPTEDKPRKRNGAYLFDGQRGVVKNWATMESFAKWPEKGERAGTQTLAQRRILMEAAERREAQERAKAAQDAERMLSEATLQKHSYLASKGFPEALGLVREDKLLIPMRDYKTRQVISLQMIGELKKFLPGGRAKGAVFVIGKGPVRWLVEGYATGLSVKAALEASWERAEVWVCFSASNLQYVAERIGGERRVFADNDAFQTGQRAAEATGLPWVMSPVEGEDANDLHQRAGIWEVVKVMRGIP